MLCCTIGAVLVGFWPNTGIEFAGGRFLGARSEKTLAAPPVGTKVPVPRLHCQTDLRVERTIMRAKDAWERALDCTVRAQQTDDERTYTAFTKLGWISANC